ncbi:MAG TPA: hypothetical protein VNE62_06995 [Actinomycetota bacterium]|nr:hypothetical protein [Actinomycetota bacterium]
MTDEPTRVTCARCGMSGEAAVGGLPSGWSILTEDRRVQYVCSDCVRRNIRAIEGKLPEEYWEA